MNCAQNSRKRNHSCLTPVGFAKRGMRTQQERTQLRSDIHPHLMSFSKLDMYTLQLSSRHAHEFVGIEFSVRTEATSSRPCHFKTFALHSLCRMSCNDCEGQRRGPVANSRVGDPICKYDV